MKTFNLITLICFLLFLSSCTSHKPSPDTRERLLELFKDPPAEFRSMPLWVWNNRITEQQIDEQLSDFKDKGFGGVFVHPRPGLITPYLSDEWFDRFGHAVKTGKKLGMQVWIYDENSYPSGFAGGHVPAGMPEAEGKMIRMTVTDKPDTFRREPLKVFKNSDGVWTDVTSVKPRDKGIFYVYTIERGGPSSWYGGYTYVDLMQKKVTDKFLEVTFAKGYDRFSAEYGKTIPGTFMDEPNLRTVGGHVLNYSDILFDAFQKAHGYSLADSLYRLTDDAGNFRKVRYDYYATLLQLFISGWAEPYQAFCKKNNLILTGHYWDHDWPVPEGVPDNMALTAYSGYPGIDLLMNRWSQGIGAQFGNSRMPKEIRSIANQLGLSRTFSETYGAAGWDLTFEDQKRIADWEYALGVNFMNQHISYVTITGARKRDHPQSFSYHEPWWPQYRTLADYIGRLSVALSKGEQHNDILVIEPTTTAWMYFAPSWSPQWKKEGSWGKGKIAQLSDKFDRLIIDLEKWQVEYDLGCEDIIRKHGQVSHHTFSVGKCGYKLLLLPDGLENLDSTTVSLIGRFLAKGGKVLSACGIPAFEGGVRNDRMKLLAAKYPDQFTVTETINKGMIEALCRPDVLFQNVTSDSMLFHHLRRLADARLLFLVNSHKSAAASGTVMLPGKSVEKWDLFTGEVQPYEFTNSENKVQVSFSLNPGGSLLLCFKDKKGDNPVPAKPGPGTTLQLKQTAVHRLAANVLTLDYCNLRLEKVMKGPEYFYQAQTRVYQSVGFRKNPWDNGVQFKSQLLEKDSFPASQGFDATWSFAVAQGTDITGMKAVVERPAYFRVSVNGVPVSADPSNWWLDKDFALYDISAQVKPGMNNLTVSVKPMRILAELEPIYILGNFSLKSEKAGYSLVPALEPGIGSWKAYGMPMYGGKVSYSTTFDAGPKKDKVFNFKPGKWEGVVAELTINKQPAGILINDREGKDITRWIRDGENEVELIVCGSLRNVLGPFHSDRTTGSTWPSMFWRSPATGQPPGDQYYTLDYGLMEPFEITVHN